MAALAVAFAGGADRAALRASGHGGAGLSRGPAAVASPAAEAAGAPEAPSKAQPCVAVAGLPGVGAAFPARARDSVHQQPGGAGHADEEGAPEDFGRVPVQAGAPDFATLRNVLSSARKQGRNRRKALRQRPEVLFAALPP